MASRVAPATPRAQLARVLVGAVVAVVVGAGPAVAWDISTQVPRTEPRSLTPRPSPWKTAGKQVKAAIGGIARVYLPRPQNAPGSEELAGATTPPVPAPSPSILAPPPPAARPMPHVTMLGPVTVE